MLALVAAASAGAVDLKWREGTVRGFPVLVDPGSGQVVAQGDYTQRVSGNRLFVTTAFDFGDGRKVEERTEFVQGKQLVQKQWHWTETVGGAPQRLFEVDFDTGEAHAMKVEKGERKEWKGKVQVTPGETFGGGGFAFALKNLAEQLKGGDSVELSAVAFTPQPRVVKVKVLGQGQDTVRLTGRSLPAEHLVIQPEIPWIAKPFVHAPDNHLWFHRGTPPTFLRADGPLMEPGDRILRTEAQAPGAGAAPRAARRQAAEKR